MSQGHPSLVLFEPGLKHYNVLYTQYTGAAGGSSFVYSPDLHRVKKQQRACVWQLLASSVPSKGGYKDSDGWCQCTAASQDHQGVRPQLWVLGVLL